MLHSIVHLISNGLIFSGFLIMGMGWRRIHSAQGGLVTDGIYKWVRHPQYVGLFLVSVGLLIQWPTIATLASWPLVSVGLLIQWPTIATLASWPVLMGVYYRLANREEREMVMRFGENYLRYKKRVRGFFPFRFRSNAGEVLI
jgi:protein-S-isoprenylcysteine O-methyltransferase Ste14